MKTKEIRNQLVKWAEKHFEGAEQVTVEKNQFGNWEVEVDWDSGYFVEIYSYKFEDGKFRNIGVTEIHY